MSEQRLRLAKYLNQRQFYHATFSEIRHDNQDNPQVLLKDIYPVYEDGHKVPLRSKYTLTDEKGHQIAASHLWTPLSPDFLKVSHELLYGDQIQFSAVVETYPIVRDNVLETRRRLWQQNKIDRNKIYQRYKEHSTALFNTMTDEKRKAYKAYKKHLLTFDEMKDAQAKADKEFKQLRAKDYKKCTRKMDNHSKRVQKQIASIPLLDYTLTDVQHVKVVKLNRHFNLKVRFKYDIARLKDIRYTKFLAAHSIFAREDNLSGWINKDDEK